jgi:hypothetical protein
MDDTGTPPPALRLLMGYRRERDFLVQYLLKKFCAAILDRCGNVFAIGRDEEQQQ